MLDEKNNSEINLNVKIPPEQTEGSFSMRDLVLTVYSAKKLFLAWCCIGLLLGILGSGAYFVMQRGAEVQGDASATLTLNYYGSESGLFPNGERFSARSFFDYGIFENALASLELGEVTVGDIINEVEIRPEEGKYNAFVFTIPQLGNVFSSTSDKQDFLQALCQEYKNFIADKYYTKNTVGKLYDQHLSEIEKQIQDVDLWTTDPFSFENNFSKISEYYSELETILELLYLAEPNYASPDDLSFEDYAKQMYEIRKNEIEEWLTKLQYNIYIRNIDQFAKEARYRIDVMERNRDYNQELASSYGELLTAFQQKDAQGAIVPEAVKVLTEAQGSVSAAADFQRQIDQMHYDLDMLEENEDSIRQNSREAETALGGAIAGLKKNQENIRKIIYEYYEAQNTRNAENSVLYSAVAITTPEGEPASAGVSVMRLAMIFLGLTFLGFVVGFCAAFLKKYLPEKK
ncbi:MAG: hypothetical protein FWH48_05350 [Oscillospiraceae bacterium]|nr:hypothetical protein [Oscillospiraceae bacterium]